MADNFEPTAAEIALLKAKRAADEEGKVDLDSIKPGMSDDQVKKVKARILELLTQH